MSLLDKVIAAVTPPETDEARAEARAWTRAAASQTGWLALVLEQHLQIESAFVAVSGAVSPAERVVAQKKLAAILAGHSGAEEAVLYPALALNDEKGHAQTGYAEQSEVKIQMAALEMLDPISQAYFDKLEHIRSAVAHHIYEEEGTWYPGLIRKIAPALHAKLTLRYREEFERYVPGNQQAPGVPARLPGTPTVTLVS